MTTNDVQVLEHQLRERDIETGELKAKLLLPRTEWHTNPGLEGLVHTGPHGYDPECLRCQIHEAEAYAMKILGIEDY